MYAGAPTRTAGRVPSSTCGTARFKSEREWLVRDERTPPIALGVTPGSWSAIGGPGLPIRGWGADRIGISLKLHRICVDLAVARCRARGAPSCLQCACRISPPDRFAQKVEPPHAGQARWLSRSGRVERCGFSYRSRPVRRLVRRSEYVPNRRGSRHRQSTRREDARTGRVVGAHHVFAPGGIARSASTGDPAHHRA